MLDDSVSALRAEILTMDQAAKDRALKARLEMEAARQEQHASNVIYQSLRTFSTLTLKTLATLATELLRVRGTDATFVLAPQRKVYLNALWRGIHLLVADGHLDGYVVYAGLASDHAFWKRTGEELNVYGGITFRGFGPKLDLTQAVENLWYLGFDTGVREGIPRLDLERTMLEAKALLHQLLGLRYILPQVGRLS